MSQKSLKIEKMPQSAKNAIDTLQAGNKRFVAGTRAGDASPKRRQEILAGQHPYASVLTCSDSRVVPEFIFDCGLGDIFVVRTAGNVLDEVSLGSLEYGGEHLQTPVIVVLGHTRCGAVTAACAGACEEEGCLAHVIEAILPAVEKCGLSPNAGKDQLVEAAAQQNVQDMVTQIPQKSMVLHHLMQQGKVAVIGAFYRLETGEVEFYL